MNEHRKSEPKGEHFMRSGPGGMPVEKVTLPEHPDLPGEEHFVVRVDTTGWCCHGCDASKPERFVFIRAGYSDDRPYHFFCDQCVKMMHMLVEGRCGYDVEVKFGFKKSEDEEDEKSSGA